MLVSLKNEDVKCVITLYNERLENVCKYNYLGVIVDSCLSLSEFVDDKYKKVNLRVHQLGKIRKFVTADIACSIYKQTILPLIDYADFMIESAPKTRSDRLELLQDKALRYIDNNVNCNKCVDLHLIYRVQPLKLRWREHICCIMYRQSKLYNKLNHRRPSINLRSNRKVKFKKKLKRTYQVYLKSPMSRGIKIWDMLTVEVQKATTKVKDRHG